MKLRRLLPLAILLLAPCSFGGIFNTVHFLDPGKVSLGLEPELTLTDGAGLGFNAKVGYGLNDLMNTAAFVGTGGGPREFRVGGDLVFDFFPDIDRQPGIGVLTRAIYYRVPDAMDGGDKGRFELIGAPYIHKALLTGNGQDEVDPFISIPIGMAFTDGNYHATTQFVVGSMFKSTAQLRYSLELGLDLNYSETYISGGITFYP